MCPYKTTYPLTFTVAFGIDLKDHLWRFMDEGPAARLLFIIIIGPIDVHGLDFPIIVEVDR